MNLSATRGGKIISRMFARSSIPVRKQGSTCQSQPEPRYFVNSPETKSSDSGHSDLHPLNFVLDAAIQRMLAERGKVRIFGEPPEIAIAEIYGAVESIGGGGDFSVETVAAGEIVKNERVGWFQFRELFVDVEAVLVLATLGIMIAQDLESLDIVRIPLNNPLHKADFDVEFSGFFARQSAGFGTAFFRHTTE
jgi:hypothetical protein